MAGYLQPLDSHPLRQQGEKRLDIALTLIGLPEFRQEERASDPDVLISGKALLRAPLSSMAERQAGKE
jgi:hypothetical protein